MRGEKRRASRIHKLRGQKRKKTLSLRGNGKQKKWGKKVKGRVKQTPNALKKGELESGGNSTQRASE